MAKIVRSAFCLVILFFLIHESSARALMHDSAGPTRAYFGSEKTWTNCLFWQQTCLQYRLNCDLYVEFCTIHKTMEPSASPTPTSEADADAT